VIVATLRALTLQLKWVLVLRPGRPAGVVRHRPVFYQFARGLRICREHRGDLSRLARRRHGAAGVFAVMLTASSTDGLSPAPEIAERAVAHFSSGFRMRGTRRVAVIVLTLPPAAAAFRVIGDNCLHHLGALFRRVMRWRRSSVESVIRDTARFLRMCIWAAFMNDTVLPVLRHLIAYWSDDAPARGRSGGRPQRG
jgi:hypothetical protein